MIACDHHKLDLGDRDALVDAVRVAEAAAHRQRGGVYRGRSRGDAKPAEPRRSTRAAPAILAEEAKHIDAALIHFSTDYVFDGASTAPYDEQAPTGPLNVYGRDQAAGERAIAAIGGAHLILRTSWVYGLRGAQFPADDAAARSGTR